MVDAALARLFSLEGKVALVTGASRGIGAALAEGLAGAGARVVGVARSPVPRDAFRQPVRYVAADVAVGLDALVAEIVAEHGRIDVLVNAAGVSVSASSDQALAAFDATLDVNLRAAYAACLAAAPHMTSGGSIINVTSINSLVGFPGNPGYVAAKGGLRLLTKALAVDLGPRDIRVNALAPGYIRTDMTAASFADPERHAARARHTCLGRWGEVGDLIGAAIFLASDASRYMTGQDLVIDGGWTAKGLT
ncbi:SDR family oxidoreductase [Caulobacter sp. UNC279MFTsu5.1]|uniref:SDR family oxidoreductase n=1 Tax=Caulobacter sp. UNC279MFTsu5.1 TaxID=1502775 RepID=UPI00037EAA8C|nr:SDR family oxidoreductase [Caulobacter sp. UNC279MFTsu5.1]SFK34705.1 gluconate 5-dehydrogenase [Caulobacter sp. UNC279MFTsu5.1]